MRSLFLTILFAVDIALLYGTNVSVTGSASLLLFLLPGYFLGRSAFVNVADPFIRLSLRLGAAFASALLFLYLLQALPGAPNAQDLFIVLNLFSIAAIWRNRCASSFRQFLGFESALPAAIVVLAAVFRLTALGSAEYQGDEARAVILATGVSNGQKDILFVHKKGPAEALFVAPSLILKGTTNEYSARLPFSLAGIAAMLALFALVRGFDSPRLNLAAAIAAALLCFDGFHVAFSRIVQYQSLLVFFLLCAALSALEIRRQGAAAGHFVSACAVFCAAALLCHYDAAMAFPAIALLVWQSLSIVGLSVAAIMRTLAFPLIQFIVLCSAFYIPFLQSEHFAATAGYLSQRIGAHKLPTNNLPRYVDLLSFYGGAYQTYFVYGTLTVAFFFWLSACIPIRRAAAGALGLALLLMNYRSDLAFVWLAAPFAVLLLDRNCPPPRKVFLLWTWVGLTVLGCFFARPNTHFYVVHCANAALIGLFLAQIMHLPVFQRRAILRFGLCALLAGVAALSANYIRVAYLTPGIEYRFAYAKVRPFLFPDSFREGLPAGAYFGFQHRSGWKTIGALVQDGTLRGSYDSNEEDLITVWYTRGMQRSAENPDYYFIAARAKDPVKVPQRRIETEYAFWGRVYTDERRSLDIYSRIKPSAAPQRLELNEYETAFDRGSTRAFDARRAVLNAVSR